MRGLDALADALLGATQRLQTAEEIARIRMARDVSPIIRRVYQRELRRAIRKHTARRSGKLRGVRVRTRAQQGVVNISNNRKTMSATNATLSRERRVSFLGDAREKLMASDEVNSVIRERYTARLLEAYRLLS